MTQSRLPVADVLYLHGKAQEGYHEKAALAARARFGNQVFVRGVVEENVSAEGFQERPLVAAAEEQRFVEAHAPVAQGQDHALVRGRGTRGDERGADRRILLGKGLLQSMQRGEETAGTTYGS